MITKADFPTLTDDLQSIFNENMRTGIADAVGMSVFNVYETDRLTYDHLIMHGLPGPSAVAEGQDLPLVNSDEGDSITWTQQYYGSRFAVTKKMRKFDLYNQIRQLPKSMAVAATDYIDQQMADVLTNGWSTSYTDVYGRTETSTGPDGLALFSTVHTNGVSTSAATFRNQIKNSSGTENPALSRDAIIQARVDSMTYTDPEGITRPIRLDTLLVAPSNEDLAERLIFSTNLPGGPDNDINALKGKIKNLKVWERLETRSDGTDTSAYWFMYDSSKADESLQYLFAERPTLDAPEEVYSNKNWEYTLDFYAAIGRGFPAYIRGSQGDNN